MKPMYWKSIKNFKITHIILSYENDNFFSSFDQYDVFIYLLGIKIKLKFMNAFIL